MAKKLRPEQVFTPRSPTVNEDMYISRGNLEDRLSDALAGNRYIVIHGESGNGKTWLYKKVLSAEGFSTTTVSLSNAKLYGSLSLAIDDKLGVLGYVENTESQTKTSGKFGSSGTGVSREKTHKEAFQARGSFSKLVKHIRDAASSGRAALVFDNFEQIIDDEDLLSQLRALIITADDEDITQYNVRVIIVGVPANLKDLISKTSGASPIINRLVEIPEVNRIEEEASVGLLKKGLFRYLQLKADGLTQNQIASTIAFMADGIAQQIHEFALHVAQQAVRNNDHINMTVLQTAMRNWVSSTLSADWAIIENAMNSRRTEVGRKNQVLFCIARSERSEFKTPDIEKDLKKTFDTGSTTLNISQVLSGFASGDNPILERTPKDDGWRFTSPKVRIALRIGLIQAEDGRVVKANYLDKLV